jgi:hypothetical protein
MAAITLNDLPMNTALDRKAMSLVRGAGGAPWVTGAFRPFVPAVPSVGSVANFFQIENNFYQIDNSVHVDKMINQFQTILINNSGNNSPITAVPLGFQNT